MLRRWVRDFGQNASNSYIRECPMLHKQCHLLLYILTKLVKLSKLVIVNQQLTNEQKSIHNKHQIVQVGNSCSRTFHWGAPLPASKPTVTKHCDNLRLVARSGTQVTTACNHTQPVQCCHLLHLKPAVRISFLRSLFQIFFGCHLPLWPCGVQCTWWGITTGPPWFLLYSLWTNTPCSAHLAMPSSLILSVCSRRFHFLPLTWSSTCFWSVFCLFVGY